PQLATASAATTTSANLLASPRIMSASRQRGERRRPAATPATTTRVASCPRIMGAEPQWVKRRGPGFRRPTRCGNAHEPAASAKESPILHPMEPKLREWHSSSGATPIFLSNTFSYDGAGNIEAIGAHRYRYDGVSRSVESSEILGGPLNFTRQTSFDGFGNIQQMTTQGSGLTMPTSGSTNRLTGAVAMTSKATRAPTGASARVIIAASFSQR
ncbi:MAG: hypothetical protein ACREA0_07475, partial [bacterium]